MQHRRHRAFGGASGDGPVPAGGVRVGALQPGPVHDRGGHRRGNQPRCHIRTLRSWRDPRRRCVRLTDAAVATFARHETFHPRYGWFRKAYSTAAEDPFVFGRPDAPVVLGVGKNMVRAIRFWGLAAKLITEDPAAANRRKPGLLPTRFGHALFGESGWDRYMEDPGTLWLLHWLLLAPPSRLPVWWLAFNSFDAVEFSEGDLEAAVSAQLEMSTWGAPHRSSISKDVGALLRTYAPAADSSRRSIDDVLDCPLRDLNLIGRSAATGRLRFTLGAKDSLPPYVAAYAALDWVARSGTGGNTVTLSRLAHEPGSVGRAFKLDESELLTVLAPAVAHCEPLGLASPTGAVQLSWSEPPEQVAVGLLDAYYGGAASDDGTLRAGFEGDRPIADDLLEELGLGRNPDDPLRRLHQRDVDGAELSSTAGPPAAVAQR
ncbi:MAG: DUF4007 family protein [Acidimicrobiia bacterium]|nr:DUF4007 family protein [Acidimicrobiia bacterium]